MNDLFDGTHCDVIGDLIERKSGRARKIMEILRDCEWHSTYDMMESLYPTEAPGQRLCRLGGSVFALKRDVQKVGYTILGKDDGSDKQKYWYKMERAANG